MCLELHLESLTTLPPAEIKPNSFQSRQNYFLTNSGRAPSLRACFQATYCFYSLTSAHAPSNAFRNLPSNSARTGYATERALLTSAQLSSDTVSDLRKVWVLKDCGRNIASRHARVHEARPPRIKKRVPSRFKRLWLDLCWRKQRGS